jgi:cell division septation protein DedD
MFNFPSPPSWPNPIQPPGLTVPPLRLSVPSEGSSPAAPAPKRMKLSLLSDDVAPEMLMMPTPSPVLVPSAPPTSEPFHLRLGSGAGGGEAEK